MERVDVAVVGAGPAGATAARLLAARGARVTLLEARRIPRPKLCGGGLTPKAQPYLPDTARDTVVREVRRCELANGRVPPLVLRVPGTPIAFVERAPFDAALTAAAAAGADVRDGWPVQELDPTDAERGGRGGATLRGPRGTLRADVVLAADGDPSRIAQRLGLTAPRRRSLALEVDLPFAARRPDTLQLRFGVPGGYAWYFPKADHANVGILSWRRRHVRDLRDRLRRYIEELGLDPTAGHVKGHWIPQALRPGTVVRDRVLLIGDAAATGDPFFGEGISYAMASAALAADTIAAWADGTASLEDYERRLHQALDPAMSRLLLVAEIADRASSISILTLRFSRWARREGFSGVVGTAAPFRLPRAQDQAEARASRVRA
jgi:geranylgeranyl reductase family protein